MILFLLSFKVTTNWSIFSSEVDILPACEICNLIGNKLKNNSTFEINAQNGSECANPNTSNRYCHLIKNVTLDIKANFPENIPTSPCALIGPCVPNSIPDYTGEYCYPCRFIYALAQLSKASNKSQYVRGFCSTTRNVFSNFCSKIDEETRSNSFYNLIDSPKSAVPSSVCNNYCKKKVRSGSKSHKSKEPLHHNKTNHQFHSKEDL